MLLFKSTTSSSFFSIITMTKEQLREKLDNIRFQLKKIDYEELHKVYVAFNWQWGGYEEPKFIPEFRDLKRLAAALFEEMRENMLFEFSEDPDRNICEDIERNNLCVELIYDRDEDDVHFFVSVKKLLSIVSADGTGNYQAAGEDEV